MRLLSYNILDGGEGRADPIGLVIEAQRPDLVALVEADDPAVIDRIAGRLKMDSVRAKGHGHSAALLSRWPIVESINHALLRPGLTKCFMEAKVRQPSGAEWIVGVVHLHARATLDDDVIRCTEIETILKLFEDHRLAHRPHLLVGDFNSDSPVQIIDPAACKQKTQKAWHDNGGMLPRNAVKMLLDAGYLDTFDAAHPQLARQTGSFTTQFPGQRIDYCFARGFDARIKDAWIEQDRLAQFASDHYPVGVEISDGLVD